LVSGGVDAISTWEPYIYNARKQLKDKAIVFPTKDIFREDFYFVAFKNFIKENPQSIKRFLKAIKKAMEFIRKNREESIDIVSQRLSLDREFVSSAWSDFVFVLRLDQSILNCLEDEARWAIKKGLVDTKEIPDYLDYIDTEPLKEISPEAITIIR
jgi:NitT/TauT family transport system substrate-binding protein